ncbi:MAG: hypothetical protein ABIQ13_06905 [Pedococcus sp.]
MHAPSKKLTVAAVGGATTLALLSAAPVAAGGAGGGGGNEEFRATGRPAVTNAFLGPDGPTQFTDRVQIRLDVKIEGARREVIRLRHPAGIATATFELEPGDSFPWHVHPGPVLVSVVSGGELSYVRASDCKVRPYAAGTVFVEPGPDLHTAFNQGTKTITLVGTFFDVAPGEALATPADPRKQLRLDKKCNLGTVLP